MRIHPSCCANLSHNPLDVTNNVTCQHINIICLCDCWPFLNAPCHVWPFDKVTALENAAAVSRTLSLSHVLSKATTSLGSRCCVGSHQFNCLILVPLTLRNAITVSFFFLFWCFLFNRAPQNACFWAAVFVGKRKARSCGAQVGWHSLFRSHLCVSWAHCFATFTFVVCN